MANVKTIKVHYFHVKVWDGDSDENRIREDNGELDVLLERLKDIGVMDRRKPRDEQYDEIRLQTLEKKHNYWKIQFARVREGVIPNKVDNAGDFSEIELDDDEYVAEDVTCLYSFSDHVMAIQRNFFSVSSPKISEYFTYIANNIFHEDKTFTFDIIKDSQQKDLHDVLIRSIEFRCIDLTNGNVSEVITGAAFGASAVTCCLNVGSKRKGELSLAREAVLHFVHKYIGNNQVTLLRGKIKETPNSPIEPIDFLQDRIETSFIIRYSKESPITHERIFASMQGKYLQVVERIRGE
jgi:hypothetical protein